MRFAKFATSLEQSQDKVVIAACLVIADYHVIADLIRNPVVAWHWIPDQVRDDKPGRRDDKTGHGMTNQASGNDKVERAQPR